MCVVEQGLPVAGDARQFDQEQKSSRYAVRSELSQDEFEVLLKRYQEAIYAYILTLFPDRFAADDVMQEAVIVMWRKLAEFKPGTNFKAWAFRIAYWQTKAHLKRVERAGLIGLEPEVLDVLALESAGEMESLEEVRFALRKCVESLPKSDAVIIEGYYLQEQSIKEVSSQTGRSSDAIKHVLMRVRRKLRKCVEQRLRYPSGESSKAAGGEKL